jgi:hypothetical protein
MRLKALFGCLVVLPLLYGCATSVSGRDAGRPEAQSRGMLVIEEAQLARRAGTLLSVMQYAAGPMEIRETSGCPEITLRGKKRFHGAAAPSIYVNGMHATNTCVLSDFLAADVRRVEIYPSGVTSRPGYVNSADGLILVFLVGSGELAQR